MPLTKRELAFLSYAHDDIKKVRKVYEGLKKRGMDVWFDKEDLKPGKWMPQIKKAIARSKYFIVCLSDAAIKKLDDDKGVQGDEFSFAYEFVMNQPENTFTIIPVRLEDCARGDNRFTIHQQYNLFPSLDKGLDKLASAL
jgi:TIR domain